MNQRVLLCASGKLGLSVAKNIFPAFDVVGVMTDHRSLEVIEWANQNSLKVFTKNPRNFCSELENFFSRKFSFLISVNYLYLIPTSFLLKAETMAINIHGSFLPQYRGRAPHIWAIINGEKETGITVHQMDGGCDTGAIILQKRISISESTTGGDLLNVFEIEYPPLILRAIDYVLEGGLLSKQDESRASYFGKRKPEDGEIDWTRTSGEVRNWVRALAKPYPGAFTFLGNKKFFVWQVAVATGLKGVDRGDAPGTVFFEEHEIYVKTGTGVLRIVDYTYELELPKNTRLRFERKKNES